MQSTHKTVSGILRALVVAGALAAASPNLALAQPVRFDIAAQPLSAALEVFARQAKMQLLYRFEAVESARANAVVGDFERREALELLLRGTGLEVVYSAGNAATIRPVRTDRAAGPAVSGAPADGSALMVSGNSSSNDSSTVYALRLAKAEGSTDPATEPQQERAELGEVIVTATRRAESVATVPYNIQAITADTLTKIGATDLRDFMRMIPGLSFEEGGPRDGTTSLVLRGLTGDYGSRTTTSTYVDDTQVDALNLKLLDIERFEVLRGPQGTLYGGGAIGGTLRFISRKPQLDRWEANASAQLSNTGRDGGMNHEVTGIINMPLVADKLALRLAAGIYDNDGYINNIRLDRKKVNWDRTLSSRLALLYAPTEDFSAQLTLYHQHVNFGTSSTIPAILGQNNIDDHYQEWTRGDEDLANLTLAYDFPFATLTSSTSYTDRDKSQHDDETYFQRRSFGVAGLSAYTNYWPKGHGTTQELRLVSRSADAWDWIAGAYWSDTVNRMHLNSYIPVPYASQQELEDALGIDITQDSAAIYHDESEYKQRALFGEIGHHFTDRLRASVGARFFDYDIDGYTYYISHYSPDGFNSDGSPRTTPLPDEIQAGNASTSGNVWRFNSSYELGHNRLVYLTIAEGFRPGGFNTDQNAPPELHQYEPDSIVSYELGTKLAFANDRVFLSTAVYHIDWSDMQTVKFGVTDAGAFYFAYTNAGKSRSQGLEFELGTRDVMLEGLALTATLGLTDMVLREDVEELGLKGDHAPLVPRKAGALMADYVFPVGSLRGGLTLRTSYTGESFNSFGPLYPSGGEIYEQNHDRKRAYWMSGAAARLEGGAWTARLFIDNLFDEDPDISVGRTRTTGEGTGERTVIRALERPRTIGVDFSYRFR